MLALHDFFLSSQLQRDGILPTWPLVAAHHSPYIALGFRESWKQAPTKKQNKATLSDLQQINFEKIRPFKKKKRFPPAIFANKKIPLKFQALTTHFVETNLQPRAPSFINGEFQPGWGARHSSQAHGAEAILDPTNLEFQVEIQLEFQFQRSLEFQFQQGGRVFLYQNISCTTFRARSTENQLWTKPSNSASARLVDFLPRCFCWVCLKNSRPTQVFHRGFFLHNYTPKK